MALELLIIFLLLAQAIFVVRMARDCLRHETENRNAWLWRIIAWNVWGAWRYFRERYQPRRERRQEEARRHSA
jgi:hypothetical protein